MNTQPHYSVHHPSVYINASDMPAAARSGAVSPVGLLNFSHWQQTRPPSVGADVAGVGDGLAAAGATDRRRGVGGDAGVVDWEEGPTSRRFQHQQQVS